MQFAALSSILMVMTAPLALVYYEKLLPGQQLVNRLQDLGYRTGVVTDSGQLLKQILQQKPMLLVTEFPARNSAVCDAIALIKANPELAHIPVLAYAAVSNEVVQEMARSAGATLLASEAGLLDQLPQLLNQILLVE
ncbi:MAG: hypothetical protein ABIP71_08510 [Verrucomicrobiota bacterium]